MVWGRGNVGLFLIRGPSLKSFGRESKVTGKSRGFTCKETNGVWRKSVTGGRVRASVPLDV